MGRQYDRDRSLAVGLEKRASADSVNRMCEFCGSPLNAHQERVCSAPKCKRAYKTALMRECRKRWRAANPVKPKIMPVHEVPCMFCGTVVQRKAHWRRPQCHKCRERRYHRQNLDLIKTNRWQARRYRIMVHILGWGDSPEEFADMIAEMRRSPMAFRGHPEDKAARRDWKNEGLRFRGRPPSEGLRP